MTLFSEYVRHGWALCAIERGSKSPRYPQWNTNPIDADVADNVPGVGLLHALSGTMALDVDNLEAAGAWLLERGVDLEALLRADDAVKISSGRANRAKLLFKLSKPLRTLKPEGAGLELRSATHEGHSVQDVLPGAIHPDTGKPYVWETGLLGDWRDLPRIPPALLALWRELADPIQTVAPGAKGSPKITINALDKLLKGKDPDAPYDEWIKVGMALHDGSGGSAEGLQLWNEWSKQSLKYKSAQDLFTHWVSFASVPGKTVVTADSLKKDTIAEPEDFDIVTPAEIESAAAADASIEAEQTQSRKEKRAGAEEVLISRLVYVQNLEKYFDIEKHHLIGSDNALEHQYTPTMPRVGKGVLNPVKVLKESKVKRYVKAMGFHPGEGALFTADGEQYANMFKARHPQPIEPMKDELEKIEWCFDRLQDEDFSKWLKQFFAHVIQRPGVKIASAPLLWCDETGNGKNTLLKEIPALLVGAQYSHDATADVLNSTFTDFLYGSWHIYLPEFRADSRGERKSITTKMKPWITDSTVTVHPKGKAAYTMPNYFFITASSNEDDAAALDPNDRRWAVHEVPAAQMTIAESKWIYDDFIRTPRAAAVLRHYFLNVDISDFHPKAPAPRTAARAQMIENARPMDHSGLIGMWERREPPFDRDVVLINEVLEAVRHTQWGRYLTSPKVGKMLAKAPIGGLSKLFKADGRTFRAVILRDKAKWLGLPGGKMYAYLTGFGDAISVDDDPMLA